MMPPDFIKNIQKNADLLYDEQQIEIALNNIASQINRQLNNKNPLVLCVINGGIITAGHLLPKLNFPLTLDSVHVSRYGHNTYADNLYWLAKPQSSLKDRTILLVDDILDEGITLDEIAHFCKKQGAKEVFSAVLVDKQRNKPKPITADFIALTSPDRYLFGYGMDYQGYLRNAPGIFACQKINAS